MILAEASGISISFDPMETEDEVGSIQFDISIKFRTRNQFSQFDVKNVWIEESELNRFETQLDRETVSELNDMSGYTIIRMQHVDDFTKIEINPIKERMSQEYDRINVTIFADYNIITYLYRALNEYAKWW